MAQRWRYLLIPCLPSLSFSLAPSPPPSRGPAAYTVTTSSPVLFFPSSNNKRPATTFPRFTLILRDACVYSSGRPRGQWV